MLACATRGGGRSEAGHCFHLLFSSFFFFFFFFFSAFYFSPTSGNLPCVKICFPQYFGITRRYMQKKLVNFYFITKKSLFLSVFSTLMPVFGRGRLGHPQSVEYTFSFSCKLFWEYFYYVFRVKFLKIFVQFLFNFSRFCLFSHNINIIVEDFGFPILYFATQI